jgi:acid phosphatase
MKNGLVSLLAVLCLLAGCAGTTRREPENLSTLKTEIVRYRESGDYDSAVATVAAEASRWIERRAAERKPGERLAVIFDIDETVLSNWENMRQMDFGYVPELWHAWVERAGAKAIDPTWETYRVARKAGVAVIFLTGRKERDREATERNLREEGLGEFERLIVRSADQEGVRAVAFKTEMRRLLAKEGWTIIANIGDQQSDLDGGYAERTFKLPNPFYRTE